MLGDVNKLFVFKCLLTMHSNVLTLHLKQTFPPIIWIFTEGAGDGIKSRLHFKIFSTLQIRWKIVVYFLQKNVHCNRGVRNDLSQEDARIFSWVKINSLEKLLFVKSKEPVKKIQIIHRLFLVVAMWCQAMLMHH